MSLPAASFEPVISYLNLASPGAEIRSGKTGNSASLRRSGHTTTGGTIVTHSISLLNSVSSPSSYTLFQALEFRTSKGEYKSFEP